MTAINRGGAVSMAARPKRCEPEARAGLIGVPGVRGLRTRVRGVMRELRREGVLKEPERVSDGRDRSRPMDSERPGEF